MSRPKNTVPAYKHHKPTNTARCWIDGRWVSLGRFNSPESRDEYARILDTHRGRGPQPITPSVAPIVSSAVARDVTVAEVYRDFWRFAEQHYRRADGTRTNELPQYR